MTPSPSPAPRRSVPERFNLRSALGSAVIYRLLILAFAFLSVPPALVHSSEIDPASELYSEAAAKHLAVHPYWFRLLHYPQGILGAVPTKSEIVQSSFFLDAKGATDPTLELHETIRALISPVTGTPDAHAQCRFIARFNWLKLQLPNLAKTAPEVDCPKFNQWIDLRRVSSLSLIFVSASTRSPASMYGHSLLRINYARRFEGEELRFPTFDYGANIGDDSAILYITKGLTGAYQGRYGDQEFFNFNHLYGVTELRDLWAYELALTPDQARRILFHAWELLDHRISFPYYFLTDNCAYRLGDLVEYAWDEPRGINAKFALWRPTIYIFHNLSDGRHDEQPLIKSIQFLPSLRTLLLWRLESLGEEERTWATRLINSAQLASDRLPENFSGESKARIVDVLLLYLRLTLKERGDRNAEDGEESNLRAQQRALLRYRSTLPVIHYPSDTGGRLDSGSPPTDGHPPDRVRAGVFRNSALHRLYEIGIWSSYHDLLGPSAGHILGSHLTTLDLRVRSDGKRTWIGQFELFQVRELVANSTGLAPLTGPAWQVRAAYEQRHLSCFDCGGFSLEGAIGRVQALSGATDLFYMLGAAYRVEDKHFRNQSLGVMPIVGLQARFRNWQGYLDGKYRSSRGEIESPAADLSASIRYTLSRTWDVRLEWRKYGGQEAGLILHLYW